MKTIYKSLAAFQQECPVIHKGTKGYGYSYASLPEIFEVINPILQKHNLGFTQLIEGDKIKTILFSIESGETIETTTEIPKNVELKGMNSFQVAGSAFTYYRRYALSSMLGIVTDIDHDASGEQVKPQQQQQKPKQPQWITPEQFEKAKSLKAKQIESVFERFKMRPEQKEELTEIYTNLKNN